MPAVFTEHLGYLMSVIFLRLSDISWFLVASELTVLFSMGICIFHCLNKCSSSFSFSSHGYCQVGLHIREAWLLFEHSTSGNECFVAALQWSETAMGHCP